MVSETRPRGRGREAVGWARHAAHASPRSCPQWPARNTHFKFARVRAGAWRSPGGIALVLRLRPSASLAPVRRPSPDVLGGREGSVGACAEAGRVAAESRRRRLASWAGGDVVAMAGTEEGVCIIGVAGYGSQVRAGR